jgi:protocatechuate 3,4-dioxygenase beta subunit
MLALLGATGAMLAGLPARSGAQAIPACVVTPAQMDGPFFTDVRLNRADIRSDPTDKSVREGAPLTLALRVATVGAAGCTALPGAMVDVWHCDAAGAYSDSDQATAGKKFLRGYQLTDANGVARFTTIYPGWYPGRAVHIHFKVRVVSAGPHLGHEFASQLYFEDAVTDRVLARLRARQARSKRRRWFVPARRQAATARAQRERQGLRRRVHGWPQDLRQTPDASRQTPVTSCACKPRP